MPNDNTFLLKADIQLDDERLQSLAALREQQALDASVEVEKIAHQLLGSKPTHCEVLSGGGTFHILYKAQNQSQTIILKTLLDSPGLSDLTLKKQFFLHSLLEQNKISVPHVLALNTDKAGCKYVAMEFVDGLSYENIPSERSEVEFNNVVTKLGRLIASLHQIPTQGSGELVVPQAGTLPLKTSAASWHSFLSSQLDKHLSICEDNAYLSSSDCKSSRAIFNELSEVVEVDEPKLLHCDLGSKNIILTPGNDLCLLDWEDAIGGDPIFDIAMWGSFMQNQGKLNYFLKGYYAEGNYAADFYLKYFLYSYRILLAKTVHRYRFQYCKSDKIPAGQRLSDALSQLKEVIV